MLFLEVFWAGLFFLERRVSLKAVEKFLNFTYPEELGVKAALEIGFFYRTDYR